MDEELVNILLPPDEMTLKCGGVSHTLPELVFVAPPPDFEFVWIRSPADDTKLELTSVTANGSAAADLASPADAGADLVNTTSRSENGDDCCHVDRCASGSANAGTACAANPLLATSVRKHF
jgi:hypothetical protein